jgi:uncharacterized protein YkwD
METHSKLTSLTLAAFTAVAAFVAIAVAGGDSRESVASTQLDPEESAFTSILNDYRAQNSLGPILIDPSIQASAEWMSTDMGVNDYFSHTDSQGGSPWDRMCDHGYCYNTWKGENIAAGYSTAADVFQGWKGSPGHNANMLGEHYVVMGIALVYTSGSTYGYYWTNDFGGYNPNPSPPPGATNTPSPTPVTPSPSPTPTPTPAPTHSPSPATSPSLPSPSPTPTPTPTPHLTPTPEPATPALTAAPTEEPTATPKPAPALADIDCDDAISASDVLALLHFIGGLGNDDGDGCPAVGEGHASGEGQSAQGSSSVHGDVDCNQVVDGRDALLVLRMLGTSQSSPIDCP